MTGQMKQIPLKLITSEDTPINKSCDNCIHDTRDREAAPSHCYNCYEDKDLPHWRSKDERLQ